MTNHKNNISHPVTKSGALISACLNRKMFDRISRRYDLLNRLISLGFDTYWRRRSIACLNIVPDGAYIDVGCGTGDLCLLLGKSYNRIKIFGLDPSRSMINIAKKKTIEAGFEDNISYQIGDALKLPYGSETFNGSIMGFCIRNVTSHKKALEELFRVLKPGGTCVVLELHVPQKKPFVFFYRFYSKFFIPFVAGLLSHKDAYDYLNSSISAFPPRDEFKGIMEQVGFSQFRVEPLFPDTVTVFSGKKTRD
jgi:demethylmenaquinone methyltransferase/2-methoxy-6-polyprenyl-1,4-benzoquinol methylase